MIWQAVRLLTRAVNGAEHGGRKEVCMARRSDLWRFFVRLVSYLPSGPEDDPRPTSIPDPNEPGINAEARQARLRLLLQRYEKEGKGSGR
jgi:hypothetical protein